MSARPELDIEWLEADYSDHVRWKEQLGETIPSFETWLATQPFEYRRAHGAVPLGGV